MLALAAAVSARPGPGFAYSVVDPGPGYAANQAVYSTATNQVVAPYTVYNTLANQAIVPYGVYNPVVYQVAACHNNDGQVVPCAGVDSAVQTVVPVEQRQVPVAIPQAPASAAPAPVAPAPQASASEQTGVISVKKREADPLYYYSGLNPISSYTSQPLVYAQQPLVYGQQPLVYGQQPLVYTNPINPVIYTAKAGCRNDLGEVVACIGEPEPVAKAAEPEAAPEAKTADIPEQVTIRAQ